MWQYNDFKRILYFHVTLYMIRQGVLVRLVLWKV